MTTTLMLDFETLSLKENATLLSLGACVFDPATGEIGETFYTAIDPRTQHGRDISASTVLWWLEQDQAARDKLTGAVKAADLLVDADPDSPEWRELAEQAAIPINHAAMAFSAWIEQLGEVECWTNGGVDHIWLNSMFEYSGFKNPIPFWKQRDYRTLKALYPDVKAETLGQAHNALDDAIKQAKHAAKIITTASVDGTPMAPHTEWLYKARGGSTGVPSDSISDLAYAVTQGSGRARFDWSQRLMPGEVVEMCYCESCMTAINRAMLSDDEQCPTCGKILTDGCRTGAPLRLVTNPKGVE